MSERSLHRGKPYRHSVLFARLENAGNRSHTHTYRQEEHVALYRDAQCTNLIGFTPWWYSSKPTRRNKYKTVNCFRYRLVWLKPLTETLH